MQLKYTFTCALYTFHQSTNNVIIIIIIIIIQLKSWGRINSYLLLRSLMAVGQKEFYSLEVLDLKLLYLRPEGINQESPYWGWVGSLRMEAALLWTLWW